MTERRVSWLAPVFLTVGLVIGFPYFITNPPGLNDQWPRFTGVILAAVFFISGYYAGRRI